MKQFKFLTLVLVAGLFMFTACEKDDDDDNGGGSGGDSESKDVVLIVKPMIGDQALQLSTNYDLNGQNMQFDFFKFYMSDIQLMDNTGTVLADNEGLPILVSTEQNEVIIGSTTSGQLNVIDFDLGLDNETNHADPIMAEGVLNDVEMHWSWSPSAGYKFIRIDYFLDGTYYESHAATDNMFREDVSVSVQNVSTAGETIRIELGVDLAVIFENHPFPAEFNHGIGSGGFNAAYMDVMASGTPFSVE